MEQPSSQKPVHPLSVQTWPDFHRVGPSLIQEPTQCDGRFVLHQSLLSRCLLSLHRLARSLYQSQATKEKSKGSSNRHEPCCLKEPRTATTTRIAAIIFRFRCYQGQAHQEDDWLDQENRTTLKAAAQLQLPTPSVLARRRRLRLRLRELGPRRWMRWRLCELAHVGRIWRAASHLERLGWSWANGAWKLAAFGKCQRRWRRGDPAQAQVCRRRHQQSSIAVEWSYSTGQFGQGSSASNDQLTDSRRSLRSRRRRLWKLLLWQLRYVASQRIPALTID